MALSEEEELELLELEEQEAQSATPEKPGYMESFGRGAAQGATLGFSDEITGAIESLATGKPYAQARDESRAAYKAAEKANPKMYLGGNVGGGLATAFVPGLNLAKGATIGKTAAQAALMGGVGGLGASEGETVAEMAPDIAQGAALGGVMGGVSKAIPQAVSSSMAKARGLLDDLTPEKVKNIDALMASAKELGVDLTPGMKSTSFTERGLENSLSQSPSPWGAFVRRAQDKAYKGISKGAEEVFESSGKSKVQSGEAIKKGFSDAIKERGEPIGELFEKIKYSTKDIDVPQASRNRISKSIVNDKMIKILPNEGLSARAKAIGESVKNLSSVDDIKSLRTYVGKALESSQDSNERAMFGKIYDKLSKLEENTMKRAAIKTARTPGEGAKIGKEMLGEMKLAKTLYKDYMTDIKDLAHGARLGDIRTPGDFTAKLEKLSGEEIVDKFFNKTNARALESMKQQTPEIFSELKDAAIEGIKNKSMVVPRGGGDKVLDPKKAVKELSKLGPEIRTLITGDKSGKLKAVETLLNSVPENVGPSGTPMGSGFNSILSKSTLTDLPRYLIYKGMPTLNNLGSIVDNVDVGKALNPAVISSAEYGARKKRKPTQRELVVQQMLEGR